MNANIFMDVSRELWGNVEFRAVRALRPDESEATTTGLWVILLRYLYGFHGVIDWSDPTVRAVVCDGFRESEDSVAGFIADCARAGFLDKALWEEEKHAVSKGVCEQIEYRKNKGEAGRMGGRPKKGNATSKPVSKAKSTT